MEIQDQLNKFLTAFAELPEDVKGKVFLQSNMTDTDFEILKSEFKTIVETLEQDISDSLDLKEWVMKVERPNEVVLSEVFLGLGNVETNEFNEALKIADIQDLICLNLVTFDSLGKEEQKWAIKQLKQKGETKYDVIQRIGLDPRIRFFKNGTVYYQKMSKM